MYTNQEGDISIHWDGHTSKIAVNKEGQDVQTFNSNLAEIAFGGPARFTGVQFHFHAGSEHTVEGKRHDLEMHTVHLPAEPMNGVKYAAMGLFFSVNDYNIDVNPWQEAIIDNFFESLKWEETEADPIVAEVPYGDLMNMVDMNNRWVYKGSVTTPPCDNFVYWNVLKTIYPLKEKYLEQFQEQLTRGNLEETGNWRETQPNDYSELYHVTSETGENGGILAVVIVLLCLAAASFVLMGYIAFTWTQRRKRLEQLT